MQESILSEPEQAHLGERKCSRCKEWRTLDKFKPKGKTYNSWCRKCESDHALEKYHADPNKREKRLQANLKHMYGISIDEYNELLEKQQGVCAICKQTEDVLDPRTKEKKRLRVDHDHKTGNVRGLLCHHCNLAIGFLEMKIDHLDSFLAYLNINQTAKGEK